MLIIYVITDKEYSDYKDIKLQEGFLTTSKVKVIKNYYQYEGGTHVTLELNDGKILTLSGFDLSVFTKTDRFYLDEINGSGLVCLTNKHNTVSEAVIDIKTMVKATNMGFEINNINDLITHIDEIDTYFKKNFPDNPEQASPIKFNNLTSKNQDHWCYNKWHKPA
jgi:hypothetical protein